MNVPKCRDVVDDHHAGVWDLLHSGLSFPELRKDGWIFVAVLKRSDLNVVKREVTLLPEFSASR